jgi:hypothetical protein
VESSRSVFEFRFEIATAFVVVGVIVEVLIVFLEFRKDRREYWEDLKLCKEGASSPPHKPVLWYVLVEVVAAVFVAGGVAGEFWYELKAGYADTCIEQADNARAALLEKQAGSAASSAERAQTAADAADKDAGDAQKKVGVVAKRAIEIDNDLWTTQYLLSGRRVPDAVSLKKEFEKLPHPLSVSFRSYPNDVEAYLFCDELVSVARSASIDATDQCGAWFVLNGQTVTSVQVSGPDDTTMLALEQAISDARPIGGVNAGPFGNAPHSPVYVVFVGVKMPFETGQARPTPLPQKSSPAKK